MEITLIKVLTIFILAFIQNISFTIVSRSRNRDNKKYHIIAAIFSNTIWFLTFRELVTAEMNFGLFIPYVVGTVIGSVTGMSISMWIEKLLLAESDGHLKEKKEEELTEKIKKVATDVFYNLLPPDLRKNIQE